MRNIFWMIKNYQGGYLLINRAGNSGSVGATWLPTKNGASVFPSWFDAHRKIQLFRLHGYAVTEAEVIDIGGWGQ